jgi:two-component system response regulator ChvI
MEQQFRNQQEYKGRILFVNDDADTTAVIKKGLSHHGFKVDAYEDSYSALQDFKARSYDLIILDVLMKGLDGFELYNKMRNLDEKVHVCFITASNTFYEKYKKLYPGIEKECFIQKPITIKKLANMIDSILENRSQN